MGQQQQALRVEHLDVAQLQGQPLDGVHHRWPERIRREHISESRTRAAENRTRKQCCKTAAAACSAEGGGRVQ